MKGILLSFLLALSLSAFSQNCVVINSAFITRIEGTSYRLTVNFTGNGQKHFNVSLYSGTISEATLLSTTCYPTHGAGTEIINFTSPADPIAVITPGTGNCGGASCVATTIFFSGGPLPVKLTSFYANRSGNKVQLSWKTSTEVNARNFTIQKDKGNGYVDVATVTAANAPNGSSYSYIDLDNTQGSVFYRLKISDLDGTFAYSDTRTIKGMASDTEFSVFPNPSTGNAKVTVADISGPMKVQVVDKAGRVIRNETMNNTNSLQIENLPKGTYIIRLTKANGETISRMLSVI